MPPTHKLILLLWLPLVGACAEQGQKSIPRPEESQLERIVGNQLGAAVRVTAWNAPEPQRTNLFIFSTLPPQMDEALMRRVAEKFGVKGEIEQIRGDTLGHVGYWIKKTNAANPKENQEVKFWLTIGSFSYGTGDDGYRYDSKSKTHRIIGVPSQDEAKARALEMLPLLGLTTNDLQHYPNGQIETWSSGPTISYTDKTDGQRKTIATKRNVSFWQRVSGGGRTVGVGDGGQVRFSFVSEGKVSEIEWFFRKMEKAGEAKLKTSKDIIRDLRNRNAWTWRQSVPTSLTVTNCVLAYPQGNSWLYQQYVWPFYMVTGTGSGGNPVTFFVPLEW